MEEIEQQESHETNIGLSGDISESPYETFTIEGDNVNNEEEKPTGQPTGQDTGDFNLADFVAKEVGIEDYTFLTGDKNAPMEKDIRELSLAQQIAMLKNHYSTSNTVEENNSNGIEVSNHEKAVIDLLREGKLEHLYNELGRELNIESPVNNDPISDDDYIDWKHRSDYGDLTEEQLESERESLKSSSNYEMKLEAIKNQYNQFKQQEVEFKQFEEKQSAQQEMQNFANQAIDAATKINNIGDFITLDESDNDLRNEALSDILEYENEGDELTKLPKFLDTPDGLMYTALVLRSLPKIKEYTESLITENRQLKGQLESAGETKTVIESGKNEDKRQRVYFDEIPSLEPYTN